MRWQLFLPALLFGVLWYFVINWNIFIALTAVFFLCALFMKKDTEGAVLGGFLNTSLIILGIAVLLVLLAVGIGVGAWLLGG